MVGIWAEGFETHTQSGQLQRKYASFSGSFTQNTGRVFGNSGGPNNSIAVTPSLGLQNTWIFGWAMRINTQQTLLNSGARGFYFERGSAEQCHVEVVSNASDFEIRLMRGATQLDITTENFAYGVWHHFEISVTFNTTTGAYELRHNEVNVMSGSSVDTADSGSNQAEIFAIRIGVNVSAATSLDDINLKDSSGTTNNSFLGDQVVEAVEVTANGVTNDWVNDDTAIPDINNFGQVDDVGTSAPDDLGPGGTVSSDTNTDRELYVMGDLVQIQGNVSFVHVGIQASMLAAGTRELRFVFRDGGGGIATAGQFTIDNTAFDEFVHIFNQNDVLAAPWDIAGINNGQFGFEVVS